jgi:protein involved in polysaccharide export with SLBB domain
LFGLFALAQTFAPRANAQLSTSEVFSSFQNKFGVADTLTEKLLSGRRSGFSQADAQPLEGPIDPNTYILGPGDGLYLNVYAAHSLDQDVTVTPEGKVLIPRIGEAQVAGQTLAEAQKTITKLLAKEYKSPDASLSMRRVRPVKVSVIGEVLTQGIQSVTALQRVSEIIDRAGGLKKTSSLRNIEVRTPTGTLRAKADLLRYFALGDLSANPTVLGGDVIVVPTAMRSISIYGGVAEPQRMEYSDSDSLSTVIALAHGLLPAAITDSVEIARFASSDPSHAQRMIVNYARGDNPSLVDGDQIFIRSVTQYHVPRYVSIDGEVPFPGRFAIEPGVTRLKDVIQRAGGVLPTASLDQAVLIRRVGVANLENDPEFRHIQQLATMRKDGLTDQELAYFTGRYDQLVRSSMVVDFKSLLTQADETQNILLREQDSITIPRAMGYVTVSGSVNQQGNVGYIEGGSFEDYIAKAGGFASSAERSGVRIVNPKTGSYIDPRSEHSYRIAPGDMIIVPQARSDFWKNVQNVTAITAQVLTIVAGIFLLVKK